MNIVTIIVIGITFLILIYSKDKCYHLFLFAIALALYTNLGSFLNTDVFNSFTREYFVLLVLIFLKLFDKKVFKIKKREGIAIACVVITIFLGIVLLILLPQKAYIAPFNITYDSIVLSGENLEIASFQKNNIAAIILGIIFIFAIFVSREYFLDKDYVDRTIKFLIKSFGIFCLLMFIESFLVNVLNLEYIRKYMMFLFGAEDSSRIYNYSTVRFFGLKSAFLFYTEPSYAAGPLLVYYLIKFIKTDFRKKDIIYFIASFAVAILSGSINSIIVAALGIFVLIRLILIKRNMNFKARSVIFVGIFLVSALTIFLLSKNDWVWDNILKRVFEKVYSYITLTKSANASIVSGYIRRFGNQVCYDVLKTNPLFGVGIGTTRGYGLIPSMLATFGVVGSLALVNFYRVFINIKINKQNIISFIILIALLTAFFSSSHIYSFIIIAILISYNKKLMEAVEDV